MAGQLFTPRQLAERWQVHKSTVSRLCQAGDLRAFRVGDLWRIPLESVEEFERRTANRDQAVAPAPAAQPAARHHEEASEYVAVFAGPVPWRPEVLPAASPAAARGRSTAKKRAAVSSH